jgi:thiamine pyrophosphate-dependent acetolactate synthase large subunit-like protein
MMTTVADQFAETHLRHKEVAALAASAEAHLTGGLAVCSGSRGPGNLDLINSLFDSHRSRVPVLAIAAQPSDEVGFRKADATRPPDRDSRSGRQAWRLCEPVVVPQSCCAARAAQVRTISSSHSAQSSRVPSLRAQRQAHVEWDNPYNLGITGLIGFASGYYVINNCDALLMLGTDFPCRQFYPQGTSQIAQVDIGPE